MHLTSSQVEVKRAVPRSKISSMSPSGSQALSSPTSASGKQSTSLFHGTNHVPSLGSRSTDTDNFENFSLTPDKGAMGSAASSISSYAAALKSGSQPQSGDMIPNHLSSPHHSNNAPQTFISYEMSPHTQHGILSEPVNVADYHLRHHANSLSELDLNNSSHFPFNQYDNHHFHPSFHAQQQILHQYPAHSHQYDNGNSPTTPNNSPIGPPPIPSRHRAHTESYLTMQTSSHQSHLLHNYHHRQPIYQRESPQYHSSSSTSSFGKLNPHVPNYTPEYLKEQDDHPSHFNDHSPHSLQHSDHQSIQLNQSVETHQLASSNAHWESFEGERGNLERSVSLGWAPTSITSPSRRGMSDIGLTDLQITFEISPQSHDHQQHSSSSLFQTDTAAISEEAWSSLIDLSMGGLRSDPMTIGPNGSFSELDPNDGNLAVQYDYRDSPQSLQSKAYEEHGIQELRLQAREFIPKSHHQQFEQWPTPTPGSSTLSSPSSPSTKFK